MPLRRPAVASVAIALLSPAARAAGGEGAERDFALKVLPLLSSKCFACHGDDKGKIKGELDLTSRGAMLAGGESGAPVLVPGSPTESSLYRSVTWSDPDLEMPPKENDRLSPEQVELVRSWIEAGAPWPDEAAQRRYREAEWAVEETEDGVIVATSGGLADDWTYRRYKPEDLWAFRPVRPTVADGPSPPPDPGANPIDTLHAAQLAAAGAGPAPEAEPRLLLRRVTFSLTGLPPSPEETEAFLAAWEAGPDAAWGALIDRLLDSPHYGERWASHWFDATRYADTGGMANDFERSNMWRYRDWVIRSLNDDKPYDQFVAEQIAGDELAEEAALERLGGDEASLAQLRHSGDYTEAEAEMMLGTGFLRLGPWDNAMVGDEEARQLYLDDVVNSVGQTFLATTLRCVKCHDSKFDPIPTRDYYRIYAAFAGTQMAERPLRFTAGESRARFDEGKAHVGAMLGFARAEKHKLVSRREEAAKKWYAEHGLPYKDNDARKGDPDDQKPPRNVGLDHVAEGQLKVREQDEWIWERRLERFQPMVQGVYNGDPGKLAWNRARRLRMPKQGDPDWMPVSHILGGGSLAAKGDRVTPGVLSALGVATAAGDAEDPYAIPLPVSGRRTALAKWIAHPDNPLAARAIVNRVWAGHFGRGIAANTNNFGVKGAKPTHPELLDHLAADFVAGGWSLKRLHRQILTSKVYRMATSHPDLGPLRERDPDNTLLAYFPIRRLAAEELRDAMLAATGELNRELGGLPAMPEINMEVALQPRMIQFSLAPAYQPSRTPAERNRRSIYAYRVRGQADPFLEVFNQPNPNESCEHRDSAAVTPQAFTLLNSDLMADRALALALRAESEAETLEARIARAFALALGREPEDAELARLARYAAEMRAYHAGSPPGAPTYPTKITRSLIEEFSGKSFEYEEILPIFNDYRPDTKAHQVSAGTRALADVCLLLFNAHEFAYVY